MPSNSKASKASSQARKISNRTPSPRKTRQTQSFAIRIYSEADHIHINNLDITAIYDDASILKLSPTTITSIRQHDKIDTLKLLEQESGHNPRNPNHNLQYERLQKTCQLILNPTPTQNPPT